MPNINPVDLQTLGARVTDPAQLTKGRWYAVRTNCDSTHKPLVHAKYTGVIGKYTSVVGSARHGFEVCDEDYRTFKNTLGLAKSIHRESTSIRTGKLPMGGVCEIFKFKRVKDEPVSIPRKSPYSIGNCRHNGIKEGDKFVVVSHSSGVRAGTIVTLTRDDGTLCPYFSVQGSKTRQAIYLNRLAPVVANQSNTSEPTATLSTVDQFKSEIDALRAKVQQKRGQMGKLAKEVVEFTQAIEDTREKLRASLEGYI